MEALTADDHDLAEVTSELGHFYGLWKADGQQKDKLKTQFFKLATEECGTRQPDEMLIQVEADSEDEAIAIAERYHPRYAFDAIRLEEETGPYDIIMVGRPEYISFTFVNVKDGMVYQRQVVDGKQLLDDERLLTENPQLHEEVTFALPWGDRIVRPFDTLGSEYLSLLSPFIYRDKPTVKLAAPRIASEEELAEVTED